MKRFLCSLSLVALAASAVCAAGTALAATGDMWEVTSQMTMEGMPPGMGMPAQTRRVCSAKEWTKPPVSQDDRSCETTDFKSSPTKSSWKMKCEGMTGEGEINRTSPDAYTGWIKMTASEGMMTLNLTGKKVGECDAVEAKKEREATVARVQAQVAAGEKLAADTKHQTCMAPAESLNLKMFNYQTIACTEPSYKVAFCDKLRTYEGFKLVCERVRSDPENGLAPVARFCSADPTAMKKVACPQALKNEDLDVLGQCCPVQAQAIAAEHCAGRAYTSMMGDKYQGFCATFAKDLLGAGR
jgi:hypothetical protein